MTAMARTLAWMALAALWLGLASPLSAHGGGTPRLTNVPAGPYRVYAWTEPDPWRVGEVHLSIAVTQPASAADREAGAQVEVPVTDAEILVTLTPANSASAPIVVQATRQSLLGDYYFEADTDLPAAGVWQITIAVQGEAGSGATEFEIEALEARSLNWTLVLAAGGVLLVIVALIGVWSRNQQPATPSQRPTRRTANRPPRARPSGNRIAGSK